MFQIGDTLISEEIVENDFVCNLNACKGACCVHGDAGAPLEEEEVKILKQIYPKIKPFLREKSVQSIEQQGVAVPDLDSPDDFDTPLLDGKECVYAVFNKKNIVKCGIEEAYLAGKTNWKKPVSCHLYPIRIKKYATFTAINYDRWDICNDACDLGKALKVPIYKFIKEALIRKFGNSWYETLERIAKNKNF